MDTFTVETEARLTTVDVTEQGRKALPPDSSDRATVSVRHTTCGPVVNEAEPRQLDDVETLLDDLVPDEGWRHDEIDDNSVAPCATGLAV